LKFEHNLKIQTEKNWQKDKTETGNRKNRKKKPAKTERVKLGQANQRPAWG
jgi:hypothetical protein